MKICNDVSYVCGKMIYPCKWAWSDIQFPISLLKTGVNSPYKYGKNKFKPVIQYRKVMENPVLNLGEEK